MARSKGSANFAGSLEVLAGAPLDARAVVNVKADLTDSQSYTYVYVGMIVSVKSEGKAYILTAADFTDSNNWSELGSGGSGTGGVVEGYFNPTDDLFYEESTYETAITGESGMLYVSLDTNRLYRFNGTIFVVVSDLDATVYQPAGSVLFANLPAASAGTLGFVYDIQDDFVTTSDFIEGAGKAYSAGTNVVVINHGTSSLPIYKYDVLSGVRGSGLPAGGTKGQVLTKGSATDYNAAWYTPYYYEYDGVTLSKPNFTYNDPDLVEDGVTKVFHSSWLANTSAGQNAALPDTDIVDYNRNYYVEMTKSIDGLAFVQRCRKFYTISGTNYCKQYERRCVKNGANWSYGDWAEVGGGGLPHGGTTGQALVKKSNVDEDVEWASIAPLTKTYTTDDTASTDLADADYIPFYDTSANAKKKSLWSNIVDKLKTTFQQKLTAGSNITMSGNTINATLVRDNYSTTEQVVGKWIDNKPLYQKTINFGALPNKTRKTVAHSISNLGFVVDMQAIAKNTNNNFIVIDHATGSTSDSITVVVNNTSILIDTFTDRTAFTVCYVTIQYTKTTD